MVDHSCKEEPSPAQVEATSRASTAFAGQNVEVSATPLAVANDSRIDAPVVAVLPFVAHCSAAYPSAASLPAQFDATLQFPAVVLPILVAPAFEGPVNLHFFQHFAR